MKYSKVLSNVITHIELLWNDVKYSDIIVKYNKTLWNIREMLSNVVKTP